MSDSKNGYTSKLFIGASVYALGILAFNVSTFWWVLYLEAIPVAVSVEVVIRLVKSPARMKGHALHCSLLVASAWAGGAVAYQLTTTRRGSAIFWIIFTMVVAFDTFSQVVGVAWGKFGNVHKIAPVESKNKTFEGFAGGYLASITAGALVRYFLENRLALHGSEKLVLSIVMGYLPIVAYLGDLNESMAKRRLFERKNHHIEPLKDFSRVLWTVGGVSDRFDGMLMTVSIMGSASLVLL